MTNLAEQILLSNISIRGTIAKGKPEETIFQKSPNGQLIYSGPKIPTNPNTEAQQAARMRFKIASESAKLLTQEEIQQINQTIQQLCLPLNWRTFHISDMLNFLKDG